MSSGVWWDLRFSKGEALNTRSLIHFPFRMIGIWNYFPSLKALNFWLARIEKAPSWISNALAQVQPRHLVVKLSPVFPFKRGEMTFGGEEIVPDSERKICTRFDDLLLVLESRLNKITYYIFSVSVKKGGTERNTYLSFHTKATTD